MTITSLSTTLVELPFAEPIGTSIHAMRSVGCVLVEVRTADGVVGQGFSFTLNAARLRSVDEMIRGFAPFVEGRSVFDSQAIWTSIFTEINATGRKGVTVLALAAIDTAVWDAAARTVGLPLHRMWGSCREEIDTYASSGLWLSTPLAELGAEAAAHVDAGFRAVKLRLGSPDRRVDIERVRAVRDAVGDGIGILVDVNQALVPKEAIRLGRALEEFDLVWYEEPVDADDLVGHAEVRSAITIPVASGETLYTRFGIQALLDHRGADIVMPDLQRIGGPSEFRRAAAAASARHVPVSSHFFTEYSLSLAGSLPAVTSIEHIDWFTPLFAETMELRDGRLVVPDRPGTGFRFDPDAVAAHRLA